MNLTRNDIAKASQKIGLTDLQAENLWQAFQEIQGSKPKFKILTALLYLGAIIAISSMTWFYTSHVDSWKSLLISSLYAITFFATGAYFWNIKKLKLPGGLLSSLGIAMVPLVLYSFLKVLNWSPIDSSDTYNGFFYWIHTKWVPMEIATLLASCFVLYFIRFPFITVLIYFVIWFISMDAIHLFVDHTKDFWTYYRIVSIGIGSLLNILGFCLCRKNQTDFGFWSYLFGMLLSWGSLTSWNIQTEWGYFTYFLINLGFLLFSGFFHRKIFMFFGALGIVYYIGHLAYIFSDSLMFSYILGAIGFSVIMIAVFLMRSKKILSSD